MRRVAFNLLTLMPGATALPPVKAKLERRTVGAVATASARYCYSVWLRHLALAARQGLDTRVRAVAELGPGASIGTGLAALLTGAESYHALDVVNHQLHPERNRAILEELIELLAARAPIPAAAEFPNLHPDLPDYGFPHDALPEARLQAALAPERLRRLRAALEPGAASDMIRCRIPWTDAGVIEPESVDVIFSQAALEHVDELSATYAAMRRWLRTGGYLSHEIDLASHGWSLRWDGHRAYSDLTWSLIRGKDSWSINRVPWSTHRHLIEANGFKLVYQQLVRRSPTVPRAKLSSRFRAITEEDREASGAFVLAVK